MIEYFKYGLCLLLAIIGTAILGLLFFKIMDIVSYITNKLGDLIFGKEKQMAKVEFIPRHEYPICWKCEGQGCGICNYNGRFKREFYHLVYTTKSGQKIAFGVDGLK